MGSVLLQDEVNQAQGRDIAINMDGMDRERYQQQLQLIEENVSLMKLFIYLCNNYG